MLRTHSKILENKGYIPEGKDVNASVRADLLEIIQSLDKGNAVPFMDIQRATKLSPAELQKILVDMRNQHLVNIVGDANAKSLKDFKIALTNLARQAAVVALSRF